MIKLVANFRILVTPRPLGELQLRRMDNALCQVQIQVMNIKIYMLLPSQTSPVTVLYVLCCYYVGVSEFAKKQSQWTTKDRGEVHWR
jgi:hypothetical protein